VKEREGSERSGRGVDSEREKEEGGSRGGNETHVRLETTDHDREIRLLHNFLDLGVRYASDVNAAETVLRVLVNGSTTHRRCVEADAGSLDEVTNEVTNTVTNGAGVNL
jgi:hypothetical protein